jgi:hypothetical protein
MRVFVMVFVIAALVTPALAQDYEIFGYIAPTRGYDPSWPPDGSDWHKIRPADVFCTYGNQDGHDDTDGDGQIDICENVMIDGVWKHIEWVGPTISLQPMEPGRPVITYMVEPVDGSRQNEYHIVHPPELFCMGLTTTNPIPLEPCSYVMVESPPELAGEYHVIEVETNIHTGGGSPVEKSTWGKIKDFFSQLFR